MYKIVVRKPVIKFLKAHPEVQKVFKRSMIELSKDPFSDTLDIKKLNWRNTEYRLRIWKWRFLYAIDKWIVTITFFEAGGRGDVLNNLEFTNVFWWKRLIGTQKSLRLIS